MTEQQPCSALWPHNPRVSCEERAGHRGDHGGWDPDAGRRTGWESESVDDYLAHNGRDASRRHDEFIGEAARRAREREDAARRAARHGTGIPLEAAAAWSQDEWVVGTMDDFRHFLRARSEPFTTPEHFWPLIDAPREMRAMSVVVQHAIRHGWIEEIGAKRLREIYRTRDGVEFPLNKLVPIYQSTLAEEVPAPALS